MKAGVRVGHVFELAEADGAVGVRGAGPVGIGLAPGRGCLGILPGGQVGRGDGVFVFGSVAHLEDVQTMRRCCL